MTNNRAPEAPFVSAFPAVKKTLLCEQAKHAIHKVHYNESTKSLIMNEYRADACIYILGTRPKTSFVPDKFGIRLEGDKEWFCGQLQIINNGDVRNFYFEADVSALTEYIKSEIMASNVLLDTVKASFAVGPYPHTQIDVNLKYSMKDGGEDTDTGHVEIEKFQKFFRWYIPEIQDVKIEYIGRSTGIKNFSNAVMRLSGDHKPRRKLEGKAASEGDIDILALYLNYDAVCVSEKGDVEEICMPNPPIINVLEGVLINYFKPAYNTEDYSDTPHKIDERRYVIEQGISSIRADLFSDEVCTRLYTDLRTRSFGNVVQGTFGASEDEYAKVTADNGVYEGQFETAQTRFLVQNSELIKNRTDEYKPPFASYLSSVEGMGKIEGLRKKDVKRLFRIVIGYYSSIAGVYATPRIDQALFDDCENSVSGFFVSNDFARTKFASFVVYFFHSFIDGIFMRTKWDANFAVTSMLVDNKSKVSISQYNNFYNMMHHDLISKFPLLSQLIEDVVQFRRGNWKTPFEIYSETAIDIYNIDSDAKTQLRNDVIKMTAPELLQFLGQLARRMQLAFADLRNINADNVHRVDNTISLID